MEVGHSMRRTANAGSLASGRRTARAAVLAMVMALSAAGLAGAPAAHADVEAMAAQAAPDDDILMIVKGVTYPFSKFGLIRRLKQIPSVEAVWFDLQHGMAHIRLKPGGDVPDAELRRAIVNAAYTPGEIFRPKVQAGQSAPVLR